MKVVPNNWGKKERREFVAIAKRRQFEHLLSYGVVAIGAVIYVDITTAQIAQIARERDEEPDTYEDEQPSQLCLA